MQATDEKGTVWKASTRWIIERPGCTVALNQQQLKAVIYLGEANAALPILAYALRDALTLLLPRTGWMPLHAAGVVLPGAAQQTVLLVGPSGVGKSTLTTGLLMRGAQCISDDLLLLGPPTAETLQAHGMMKNIRVCDDVWTRLALNRHQTGAPDVFGQYAHQPKHTLTADALPTRPATTPLRTDTGTPTTIVLPTIVDIPQSQLTPVSRADALPVLMTQMVPPTLLPTSAHQAQLQQTAKLLRQCTVYRLHAGRDLYHNPSRLASLLQDVDSAPALHA